MGNYKYSIPSAKEDESVLSKAVKDAFYELEENWAGEKPGNWEFVLKDSRRIYFSDIIEEGLRHDIPRSRLMAYYKSDRYIETDSPIIYLEIYGDSVPLLKPLFISEIKKQGTNDKRIEEGKPKQAIGNAAGDRTSKNFSIISDYCYLCDKDFFPYCVLLHGYDFGKEEISETTKSKLEPFFGELNKLNPWFDKYMMIELNAKKGGSCFYQGEEYNYVQLYDIVYRCCEIGIKHYLSKLTA